MKLRSTVAAKCSLLARCESGGGRLIWVTGFYFLLCLLIQFGTRAWHADFTSFSDEPSHFVGAVMFYDWLHSGHWLEPLEFARTYYQSYPFFAIGYWPPLFYLLLAFDFLLAGIGRAQALLVPALAAAATAAFVYSLLRNRAGRIPALCAGIIYLSLPGIQRSMCAVMVDHVTAAFCIGFGICFLRYLQRPGCFNAVLCSIVCGLGILAKYSAAYLLAVPFITVLLLRRANLLKKPSFVIQPFLVALIAGPWMIWTRKLMYYGLPTEQPALNLLRGMQFLTEPFHLFPLPLLPVILAGLLLLIALRRAWGQDVLVLVLIGFLNLAFLFISPVEADPRYMLAPAAVILALSAAGWAAGLPLVPGLRRRAKAAPLFAAAVAAACFWASFGRYPRPAQQEIHTAVEAIVRNPAWDGQTLLVPADLEGPTIAEFAAQVQGRRGYRLLRPSKVLASSDWFGNHYSSRFSTPEQLLGYFRSASVQVIMWHAGPEAAVWPHGRLLVEMFAKYGSEWPLAATLRCGSAAPCWYIYSHTTPARARF